MNENESQRGGYSASDHRVMLADSILEILELSANVKELHNQFLLLQEDIDTLNRSLNDFREQVSQVKENTAEHMTNTAVQAFDEQLRRVEDMIDRLVLDKKANSKSKSSWWRFIFK